MSRHFLLLNTGMLFIFFSIFPACFQNALPSAFYGTWTVVEHKEPGISAMNQNEIDAWMEKELHYSKLTASLLVESCQFPTYNSKLISTQDFQTAFHFKPAFLGYTGQLIEAINISCSNDDWISPGSSLIWLGREQLFMVWDGVFFRLQKQSI